MGFIQQDRIFHGERKNLLCSEEQQAPGFSLALLVAVTWLPQILTLKTWLGFKLFGHRVKKSGPLPLVMRRACYESLGERITRNRSSSRAMRTIIKTAYLHAAFPAMHAIFYFFFWQTLFQEFKFPFGMLDLHECLIV